DDSVEEQEQLPAFLALAHVRRALLELAALELPALPHDRDGALALPPGLDRGRPPRGVLFAPGRVLAVRPLVPLAEVDRSGLLDEVPGIVVEPVARERA